MPLFILLSQPPSVLDIFPEGMENSSVASASSEAGSSRSQKIEELERFIDSYVLEYQVQGLLMDKMEGDGESEKTQSHISQVGGQMAHCGVGEGLRNAGGLQPGLGMHVQLKQDVVKHMIWGSLLVQLYMRSLTSW